MCTRQGQRVTRGTNGPASPEQQPGAWELSRRLLVGDWRRGRLGQ